MVRHGAWGRGKLCLGLLAVALVLLLAPGSEAVGYLPYTAYPAGGSLLYSIATADFNHDGHPDVVAANLTGIEVLLNNGSGHFGAATGTATGSGPVFVAVADMNGDSRADIVADNTGANSVTVLLNNGSGGFPTSVTYPYDPAATKKNLALGDVNGDGKPDVVVQENQNEPAGVETLLNLGGGVLGPPVFSFSDGGFTDIALGDLNGDGKLDVATSLPSAALGTGTGTFNLSYSNGFPQFGRQVQLADINGDGKLDLVLTTDLIGVSWQPGNGDGTFGARTTLATPDPVTRFKVADLNGDGHPDIAAAGLASFTSDVIFTDGHGNETSSLQVPIGAQSSDVAVADFNGDGLPDLAFAAYTGDVRLVLEGVAHAVLDAASPFANTEAGTVRTQTLTLHNTGSVNLSAGTPTITGSSAFTVPSFACTTVAAGGSCTFDVRFAPLAAGSNSATLTIVSDGGTVSTPLSGTATPDVTAPVTTATPAGTLGGGGWYLGPVTVTLAATDGVGVASTHYSIDGGAQQTYTVPFTVSGTASHTVRYSSTDTSGNVETTRTLTVPIDTAPPTTSATVDGPHAGGYFRANPTVTLSGTDVGSGVQVIDYRIDGGVAQTYTSSFTLSGDGTHQIAYWATDVAGNIESVHTTTVLIDTVSPASTASISGTAGSAGWYVSAATVTLSATDGGSGVASQLYTIDGGATTTYSGPFAIGDGAHTLRYSAVDTAGNVETTHQMAVNVDTVAPTTALALAGTAGTGGWYTSAVTATLTSTDATSGASPFYRLDGGALTPYTAAVAVNGDGTHQLDYFSVDAAGNTETTHTQTIRIDTVAPTSTASLAGTAGTNNWYRSAVTATLSASDATSGVLTLEYRLDGGPFTAYAAPVTVSGEGSHTLQLRATDEAGLVEATHSATFRIDTIAPAIAAPADVVGATDGGATGLVTAAQLGTASATDANAVTVTRSGVPAGNEFPFGSTTVTWTATDDAGNTASASQQVTILDDDAPAITAPAAVTVATDPGQAYATGVSLGTPVTSDNIAVASVTNDAPAQFPFGTTIVHWTAADTSGNTATATQVVTVVDQEPPTVVAPPPIYTVTAPGGSTATLLTLGFSSATDNVAVASFTNDAPPAFPVGTTTVTWTATDTSGNVATATQLVVVADPEPPVVTAPADVTAPTDPGQAYASGVPLGSATAADNVGVATLTNDAPAHFPFGTTTVIWTATDAAGNASHATQSVTVTDPEPPAVAAPADVVVTTDPGQPYASGVALGSATASDNVAVSSVSNDAPPHFPIGTTTVTWTAVDVAGNSRTATQLVAVADVEPPSVAVPADAHVSTGPGNTTGTVTVSDLAIGQPAAADNSGSVSIARLGVPAGNIFPVGTTTITWIATDPSANQASTTQRIVVVDDTPPVLSAVSDVSVTATSAAGAPVSFTITATDNVSTPVVVCSPASGTTFPIGTTTVTCTVTDAAGNTAQASFTVTVAGDVETLLRQLLSYAADLGLRHNYEVRLVQPLDHGLRALGKTQTKQLCKDLDDFVRSVQKQPQQLSAGDMSTMLSRDALIKSLIGCT